MFNFFGDWASLFWLVFRILRFVFAKRASTAAREARDAAMRQSLVEYLNGLARIPAELVAHLRSEMNDMALLRISDLMDQTSYVIGRWEARLPKKSKDNLSRA